MLNYISHIYSYGKYYFLTLLLIIGLFLGYHIQRSLAEKPNSKFYQAVFLTNNVTYFGKLEIGDEHYILRDIYYVKSLTNAAAKPGEAKQETKLIKFGDEVHGPQDEMFIQKRNVIFWENLRDDSKITEAIKQFKTNPQK